MCCCNNCNTKQEPIQFTIGDCQEDTPVNGTNLYSNFDIKYSKYKVHKNGVGFLTEEVDYQRTSQGGIKLLSSSVFTTGECYTFWFY